MPRGKSEVLKNNAAVSTISIILEGDGLEDVTSFTYLGSNVKARTSYARAAFLLIKNVWDPPFLTINTKIWVFNTTVKLVLVYGSQTWSTTTVTMKKIRHSSTCLRRILWIRCPGTISNRELWQWTKQQPAEDEIIQRRWRWIGHTLRKQMTRITREALTWNPQGTRRRGSPDAAILEAETK